MKILGSDTMNPIPAHCDDELGLGPAENLVTGGGRPYEQAAVDGDAHEAEEGDGRVGVEEHGEDLAAEAALAPDDPVSVTSCSAGFLATPGGYHYL